MAISTAPRIVNAVLSHLALGAFPSISSFQLTSADVVLLDLGLPDAYGRDLIPQIRACVPDTAILVLTAHGVPDSPVQALQTGAQRYFIKPIRFTARAQHIDTLCARNDKHVTHSA